MLQSTRVNLVQELQAGKEAGRFSKAPSCPVPAGRQLCSSSRFRTSRQRTTLLSFAKITINYESIDNFIKRQQRRPGGPRQLSKQEITQDLKYGISAKGSSDPGLTQVVNNVQKHRNLKSHYPLSFPREKGLELPDDIFLR